MIRNIKKDTLRGWTVIIGIFVFILHVIFEGFRWQMVPLYLILFLFFFYGIPRLIKYYKVDSSEILIKKNTLSTKIIISVVGISLLMISSTSIVLDYYLPVFHLPEPTGTYNIGTTKFELVDNDRYESFTENPFDKRKILVRAWYPADDTKGVTPAPYIENIDAFGQAIQNQYRFPSFILSHLSLVKTHSFQNVPISQKEAKFPITIFSHGYSGFDIQNTVLMEELASNGYIVFSLSHPYESGVIVLSDGEEIYFKESSTSSFDQEAFELSQEYLNIIINNDSLDAKREALQKYKELLDLNLSLDIWTNDTKFFIDQLIDLSNENIPGFLRKKFDIERIGVIGHSFGGATAGEMCLLDNRVSAGINMDGIHLGHVLEINLTKPFMLMYSTDGNAGMNNVLYLQSESICYNISIIGTKHYNYADMSIWGPLLNQIGFLGPINGYRMLYITSSYVLSFFNKYLKAIDSPLLESSLATYPEVIFQKNL